MKKVLLFTLLCSLYACSAIPPLSPSNQNETVESPGRPDASSRIQPAGTTLESRLLPPAGYDRMPVTENSFAAYLRHFPLKPDGEKVLLYNREEKGNQRIHAAVMDISTGTKDLQQCADAVMRLRGEYLYQQKQYDRLHFNFTNGFRLDYPSWIRGYRPVLDGNRVYLKLSAEPKDSPDIFLKYMEMVFNYAGTLSLETELIPVTPPSDIRIGDVFIQGGSPGHAILVMDVAEHPKTGAKIVLLAQSYMPAQDMHVLLNPNDDELSPWYRWQPEKELITPEWVFPIGSLRRFPE